MRCLFDKIKTKYVTLQHRCVVFWHYGWNVACKTLLSPFDHRKQNERSERANSLGCLTIRPVHTILGTPDCMSSSVDLRPTGKRRSHLFERNSVGHSSLNARLNSRKTLLRFSRDFTRNLLTSRKRQVKERRGSQVGRRRAVISEWPTWNPYTFFSE